MIQTMPKADIPRYHCGKMAVFSDIHSNYHALHACVSDAICAGAESFIFLGDYVSGLAGTIETLDLVYEIRNKYPTVCIRGNRERYMMDYRDKKVSFARGSNTGSYLFTYEQLRQQDLAFFDALPFFAAVQINNTVIELAHATRDSDRYYYEKGDDRIAGVYAQMEAPYLLTGHSHKQYAQSCQGKTIINPGAVGLPQGGTQRAQYAILDVEKDAVRVTFRQVPYDLAKVIREQFQSGLVSCAKYWAISELYGIITGKEYTKMLLSKMYQYAGEDRSVLDDEQVWHRFAAELGMRFTEDEIMDFMRKTAVHS